MDTPPEEIEEPEPDFYDSQEKQNMQALASELKEKLQLRKGPILLPPKDYDTVHRKQGRLENISLRKSLNEILVGRASVEASASITGDMSILAERNEDKESNDTPIYYPAKQEPEHETVYPPTSVGSPTIMRHDVPYRRRNRESTSSFLSNSSEGSNQNNRSSYTAPPLSTTSPGTKLLYENYPTLKSPDRSPVTANNPDMSKWNKPQHTRESSISSIHSGVSSHSDHSQKLSQALNEEELEIPPDYDETPQKVKSSNRVPKDEHPGYNNARISGGPIYYDHHRGYEYQGPHIANAYSQHNQHNPTYVQSTQVHLELNKKPTKRIAPILR